MLIQAVPIENPAEQEAALMKLRDALEPLGSGQVLAQSGAASNAEFSIRCKWEVSSSTISITLSLFGSASDRASILRISVPRGELNLNKLGLFARTDADQRLLCRQREPNKNRAPADTSIPFFESGDEAAFDRFVIQRRATSQARVYFVVAKLDAPPRMLLEQVQSILTSKD